MNRVIASVALVLCSVGCSSTNRAHELRREEATYRSGDAKLAGVVLSPVDGRRRHPGVVVIQGSGTSDRTNQWAAGIAESIARGGAVVLLTDKRGSGKSEGNWGLVGFDVLADDAIAGVEHLRARDDVDPARVGVIGLSQGGAIAPLAAAKSTSIAFVIDVSGAAVGFGAQVDHEMYNTTLQAGLTTADAEAIVALNHRAGEFMRNDAWDEYDKARTALLSMPAAPIAKGFPAARDDPRWSWLRKVYQYDPLPYWKQMRQPALIIYGARDEQDNVPVRKSVERLEQAFRDSGARNKTIRVFPEGDHAIRDPKTQELDAELLRLLDDWISRR